MELKTTMLREISQLQKSTYPMLSLMGSKERKKKKRRKNENIKNRKEARQNKNEEKNKGRKCRELKTKYCTCINDNGIAKPKFYTVNTQ